MKKQLLTGTLMLLSLAASAVTPMWLRDVKISPDGKDIAFTYKGDIYRVPAEGGMAVRLTNQPSFDRTPIWSPDGSKIAFASDRNGGFDIFIMNSYGGTARRLTTNSATELPEAFTSDGKSVLFSAAIQDAPSSMMFPSGRLTELYSVPVTGGATTQVLTTPAQMISFLPDGTSFLYQDQKGMEDEWRKHHTSSVTRDIWLYDAKTGKHTNLTAHAGEDRNPVATADGTIYFLSERSQGPGKSINVYSMPLSNPGQVSQVTDFKTHPVRFLSRGNNGTLAFTYDGEIYTKTGNAAPEKVNIILNEDEVEDIDYTGFSSPSQAMPSPDGKQMAVVKRGEIAVTSVEYPTTKVITKTAASESSPTWADNRTLYYASERDGASRIYKATIARDEEPDFANATIINEEAVTPDDGKERTNPDVSPDGKKMAYFVDRNQLYIMDLGSKKETRIAGTELQPQRYGYGFEWSPDSKYLAAEVNQNRHDPYTDIAIIDVKTGKVTNITNSGYTQSRPHWVMNGDAVIYNTEEFGMRNHASWGSMEDVMIAFTNQQAMDRFLLNEEDYKLWKDSKKKDKDDSEDKDEKKDKDKEKVKSPDYDFEGMEERTIRLTPFSSNLGDAYIDNDGSKLYFLVAVEKDADLWTKDLRKGDISKAKNLDGSASSLIPDRDGKNLFLLGRSMQKMPIGGGETKSISTSGHAKIDKAKEREYMFDYVVREEAQRFYDTKMHGVDWPALTEDYRKFLPFINNNYDFATMLSEMLGELNVSHTGSRYSGEPSNENTAQLGLLYDLSYTDDGLKVAEVVQYSPFDNAETKMKPGSIITAINNELITPETDLAAMFNNLAGKKTLVSFKLPGGKKVDEVIKPISSGKMGKLIYNRWVRRNEHLVDSLSNGRLGYVHIQSMDDDSFRPVYSQVLGKYNTRDGIIIDTRWNGGGRMHEDIEVLFSGKKYLTQEIRGVESCDMPSRRWNKPSVMLTAEANYSNAHGTPWVYKTMGLGKIIGAPVPGTMTSVNWVTLQDPSMYFGIPIIGYRTAQGNVLENTQLEPDILVLNAPERVAAGIDDQLETAVRELLKEVDQK